MYQYVWSSDSTKPITPITTSGPQNKTTVITHQASSNHLLQLQKEIKEEEEEIFADINSLLNERSNLYSTLGADDEVVGDEEQDDCLKLEHDDETSSTSLSHNNQILNNNNNSLHCNATFQNHASATSADEQLFANDSDYNSHSADDTTNNDYQNDSGEAITASELDQQEEEDLHHKHHFHHNITRDHLKLFNEHKPRLELDFDSGHAIDENSRYIHLTDEQQDEIDNDLQDHLADHENNPEYVDSNTLASCNHNDQQDYETLQAVIQQVTSNLPKPCVFFLEGNCRRSDCKYSHDLSNITCKYWIEGFCFKGEMCPFLHSYATPSDKQELGMFDDEAFGSLSKKELNPTFVIESEADFPSLPLDAPAGALSDSTKSCINTDAITTNIKNQILSSNPAVVFKTVKKKRKRG